MTATSRRTLACALLLVTAIFAVAAAPLPTAGATSHTITGCGAIASPGTYELGADIDGGSNATCILITASGVTLEGNGHTITGQGSYDTIGVHVNGSKIARLSAVTIANLTVTHWEQGLHWEYTDGGAITNVTAASNEHEGMFFRGAAGTTITDATTSDHTFSSNGISLVDSTGVTIAGLASTNDGDAVEITRGGDHTVRDSTFTNAADAVDLGHTGGNLIHNNTFVGGGGVYLFTTDGAPNRVTNNTATGTTWPENFCGGFWMDGANGDVFANNSLSYCYEGATIQDSEGVTFENNTIHRSEEYGVFVNGGSHHLFKDNAFTDNGNEWTPQEGLHLQGTDHVTLLRNTFSGNDFNIRLVGGSWADFDHDIDATNTVEGRPVAYHVNESSITVDPNAGWVALIGTDNATVDGMSFPANNYENILLWQADDTVVRSVASTTGWIGMQIEEGSDRTLVEASTFDRAHGVDLSRASFTHFVDTTISNSENYGAVLYESPDTTFENVTFTANDNDAIYVQQGSPRLTVTDSTATNNGGGFWINRAHWSAITSNTITDNSGGAITAGRTLHNVTIADNTITGNDGDGIHLTWYTRDNVIARNNISDNTGDGIEFGHRGNNDTIRGNVITGNARGLYFSSDYDSPRVYNNHFNNTENVDPSTDLTNAAWSVPAAAGPNIVNGPTIGGNYWANATGTGFSQTCADSDADGFCDSPYAFATGHTDALPLAPVMVPVIAASPASLDFGTVDAGTTALENVTITNDGTAPLTVTGATLTGANATNFTIVAGGSGFTLAPGASDDITVEFAPGAQGDFEATLEVASDDPYTPTLGVPLSGTGAAAGGAASVLSSAVRVLEGTAPTALPTVDATIAFDLLQLSLVDDSAGWDYDLEAIGADETTTFEVNVTVQGYTPRLLLGAGGNMTWDVVDNGDGTWNVSVVAKPVEVQGIFYDDGSTPDMNNWPTGAADRANSSENHTVQLAIDDLGVFTDAERELLNGTILATDAQSFGSPEYTAAQGDTPAALSLFVAGPHLTTAGEENQGFYDAFLPQALLDSWSVTDPGQLTAAYQGGNATLTAEAVAGGMRVSLPLHYSSGTVSISASDDTTAPTVSASLSGTAGDNGWYTSGVDVTLAASDDASGVDAIEYRLDGGPWQAYAGAFTLTDDGAHTVEARATDNAGNVGDVLTEAVNIDATAPTVNAALDGVTGGAGWYVGEVNVSFAGADATSGVAAVEYRVNGGPWTPYGGALSVADDGDHTVEARARDSAGNLGDVTSVDVQVDADGPTVSHALSGDKASNGWYTGSVDVSLSAADNVSGVDAIEYRVDNGAWAAYAGAFTVTGDGAHDVEARATDHAGHTGPVDSFTVRIDSAAADSGDGPTASFRLMSASVNATTIRPGESVTVTATVENAGSAGGATSVGLNADTGVVTYKQVHVPAGATATVTWTPTFSAEGTYTVRVDGVVAGTVTVHEPKARFAIPSVSVTPQVLTAGDAVAITATVHNTGDAAGTFAAAITADGATVASVSLTLGPGESDTISETWTPATGGTYVLAIGSQGLGDVIVNDAPNTGGDGGDGSDGGDGGDGGGGSDGGDGGGGSDDGGTASPDDEDATPGPGALVALLAALLVARLRRRRE